MNSFSLCSLRSIAAKMCAGRIRSENCWRLLSEKNVGRGEDMNPFPKIPSETTDNRPRFQPWVAGRKRGEPRGGERNIGVRPTRSFVPDGTRCLCAHQPSDESVGL